MFEHRLTQEQAQEFVRDWPDKRREVFFRQLNGESERLELMVALALALGPLEGDEEDRGGKVSELPPAEIEQKLAA